MIRSAEPDDDWQWCYVDDRIYQPVGSADTRASLTNANEVIP
jgi:hypothetical protein